MAQPAKLLRQRARFQSALLAWYHANRRQLPWREQPSIYRTVVSEFMLQQTQVATVLPYFARWLTAFPDFRALAAASEESVLRHWEGLGYYSRARNLHRLAKELVARDRLPTTAVEWRELPGVGPYTAAAIASIACHQPAACVDGNVVRILARLTADPTEFSTTTAAAKHFTPLADALLNPATPGDHNQAMMELGATLCTRNATKCPACPVRKLCACHTAGRASACGAPPPGAFPRLSPTKTEQVSVTRIWCIRNGSLLLHRAPSTARRLANQHELPTPEHAGLTESHAKHGPLLATRKRSITRYRITESIHEAELPASASCPERGRTGPSRPHLSWVPLNTLDSITLSGPHRRWIGELLERNCSWPR